MLIDISHFQGVINWSATDPAIDGAYIKVTEGTSNVDAQWAANHSGTTLHGKPAGAYHFADLGNAVAEANHFADQYTQASWQLHPVLDIETNGATAAWIVAFRNQFRARTGSQAFRVYSSLSLLTGALNPANWIDSNTTIWAARYNNTLGWNHPQLVLWQNTSSANIPGVVGHVDDDQFMNGWTPSVDTGGSSTTPTPPPSSGGGTPVTGTIPAGTVLQLSDTGNNVKILQSALNAQYPAYSHLTIDGDFGPATKSVVMEFQQRDGLTVDGAAGNQTLAALHILATASVPTPTPSTTVLRVGSTGNAVKVLQEALNKQYPAYSHLTVDGDFGPATEAVVKEFQQRAGLTVDGIVGSQTLNALHI